MKVSEVRTYQAVRFCHKLETFFSKRDTMPNVVMEATEFGVNVRMGDEDVIIPYANVAYFKPVREVSAVSKKSKE